jgi:hypothetical protein
MACEPFRIGDISGFACTRGPRRKAASCQVPGCQRPHVKLCDQELKPAQAQLPGCECVTAAPKTCDLRLCAAHAWTVPGHQDRDLCPAHRKLHEQKGGR